jgi:transcriptional regulator with XRE-family HTH domain
MSYLSLALTEALTTLGWSQTKLAHAAGITQPQANRACRGPEVPGAATAHAIARALPVEHRGQVVAAWLKDQLDEQELATVIIHAIGNAAEIPPDDKLPAELDTETRALIMWYARQAVTHTAVRDYLRSFKRACEAVTG